VGINRRELQIGRDILDYRRFKIKTEIRMPRIKNAKKDKNNNDRVGEYEEEEFIAFSQHFKKRYDYLTALLIPEGTDTVRCNARTVSARR
jgi:hypothetical protein